MSRTIVQDYGPIYGEPVNGTVMGRPNGSVYVPLSNKISISLIETFRYCVYYEDDVLRLCLSSGGSNSSPDTQFHMNAESQDLASSIQLQLFSDSGLTTMVAHTDYAAGNFSVIDRYMRNATAGLQDGDTLYARAQLMNSGIAVATSDTIEITMVVV